MRLEWGFGAIVLVAFSACVGDSTTTPDASTSDATTDTNPGNDASSDSGVDAGPWDPSQIKGLALWLDADKANKNVNGTVDTWKDSSSNHNDATQATAANQPLLLTGAQGISGHQAIHFDGTKTSMTIKDSSSLQWSASYVIELVLRVGTGNGATVYVKQVSNVGPTVFLNQSLAEFGVATITVVDAKPDGGLGASAHRIRAAYDVPSLTISSQVDVQAPVAKTLDAGVSGEGAVGADVLLGGQPAFNSYFNGDVSEIVAVAGVTIDPQDIVKLQAYLDTKYGL